MEANAAPEIARVERLRPAMHSYMLGLLARGAGLELRAWRSLARA